MKLFPYAHATHPRWQMAAALVLAQVRALMALQGYASNPNLALLYLTDHYAEHAQDILDHLGAELPEVTDWAGTVGVGIAANNVEYFDEPAMALMLLELPSDQFRVFSGVAPLGLGFDARTALVHADGSTPDIAALVHELAHRTESGCLFGGLSSGRAAHLQFALAADGTIRGHGRAGGVFTGGMSGVAFGPDVALLSRVTQGCKPVSPSYRVTAVENNLVLELDGVPALAELLRVLDIDLDQPQHAFAAIRSTLVGLSDARPGAALTGHFGQEVTVRHILGLDPVRQGVAIAEHLEVGTQLAFCQRNIHAARTDLVRVCAEIREALEPEEMPLQTAFALAQPAGESAPHPARGIAGAVYVSCASRGGPHFGGASAELQLVRKALGDVPLVGFFASGEIGHDKLYGYTGVLTVFTT